MELPDPIVTSPVITAFSAIKTSGAIFGYIPLYGKIIGISKP
jgi:hypothetical protein